jgi:hypothetical protein
MCYFITPSPTTSAPSSGLDPEPPQLSPARDPPRVALDLDQCRSAPEDWDQTDMAIMLCTFIEEEILRDGN